MRSAPIVWLTGLPAAGKSTIAGRVRDLLTAAGERVAVLDGDVVRTGLCADLGFSAADRSEQARRVGEVAALLSDVDAIVLVAVITPYAADRTRLRARLGDRLVLVYVDAPVEVCAARDPKGLYARARAGTVVGLTGVDAPYEAPTDADLVLATDRIDIETAAARVLAALRARAIS